MHCLLPDQITGIRPERSRYYSWSVDLVWKIMWVTILQKVGVSGSMNQDCSGLVWYGPYLTLLNPLYIRPSVLPSIRPSVCPFAQQNHLRAQRSQKELNFLCIIRSYCCLFSVWLKKSRTVKWKSSLCQIRIQQVLMFKLVLLDTIKL